MARNWENLEISSGNYHLAVFSLFRHFPEAIYLNPNGDQGWSKGEIAAFGSKKIVNKNTAEFSSPSNKYSSISDWKFGHFSYEFNNEKNNFLSDHPCADGFHLSSLFTPDVILRRTPDGLEIGYSDNVNREELLEIIRSNISGEIVQQRRSSPPHMQPCITREQYLHTAEQLLKHIQRGDIYELNYCIEMSGQTKELDPFQLYLILNEISEAPFSALYKSGDSWLICASPERYFSKTGNKITSQPIKGTRPRGKNKEEDERYRMELFLDPKERSENVMIVDLVRNDFTHFAEKGTVNVEELFGIHTFKTVHQMISTVTCVLRPDFDLMKALISAFPMGSMTGAPKIRAMQLIEMAEKKARGIYSGTLGFITPEGDCDFNVVIRSITWNQATGYVSVKAGSAITAACDPEKEYEECLLKLESMIKALKTE